MTETRHPRHNGHELRLTGAERVRSGFDRRKNWGDSIENVYRRIDHRLSELVHQGSKTSRELLNDASDYTDRNPVQTMAVCFVAGLVLGLFMVQGRKK